ncbi:hypothetical protein [Bacillus sp. NPDC094106]|uniref:hypothetical protein n=1 Tax=Bacillus sp. NPDC094106 TaxID=3363949 RepID=UPI00380EDF2C
MTKTELIEMLQHDNRPMDAEVEVYLECINNDTDIWGKITGLKYDKRLKSLHLTGEYEE